MQVYRNPSWAVATQTVLSSLMALIGVSIAIQPAADHPGTAPGYIACGTVIAAASVIGPRRYTENIVEAIRQARPQAATGTQAEPLA